jgi:Co/Zn/Cd efflux system component
MMHFHFVDPWTHNHGFLGEHHGKHERRTWGVVTLTACMMVAEIIGGTLFGSIALVADGWHMGTHVAALAIAGLAYLFAAATRRTRAFHSAPASSASSPRSPAPSS